MIKILMRFGLLIILLSCLGNAYAQQDKLVHFGLHVNPEYSIPILEDSELFESEKGLNFSAGADVYFDVNSKFQLYSGVTFTQWSGQQKDYSLLFSCSIVLPSDLKSSWVADKYTIQYLGIPIGGKLKLAGELNHIYARAGIEMMFAIGSKVESVLKECNAEERVIAENPKANPNDLVLNSNLGIGAEMGLGEKVKLILEPRIEYTFNQIFEDVTINSPNLTGQNLLNLGLLIGVRF